jgi:hypothetical protein
MIEWFWGSLDRECVADFSWIKVVVVDFWHHLKHRTEEITAMAPLPVTHVPPKPTVWQGMHKLTKVDYFATSNARNTGLCLAPDGWIVYLDDLSVLMPGWWAAVRESVMVGEGRIIAGAYKKVKNLFVRDGLAVSWEDFPAGVDTRWRYGNDNGPVRINGGALFGCSLLAPVEAFLQVNGWDEDCDSMSGEDYVAGLMMERNGWPVFYDRRMLTFESEEHHYQDVPFKRIIKKNPDASVVMLNMVLHGGRHRAPNYFGDGGIRVLRQRVLAGEPFPITQVPQHHWPDSQPLESME